MKIIVIFCLIGLIIQLEQISEQYFKFETRSEVRLSIPILINAPMITSCWNLKDILLESNQFLPQSNIRLFNESKKLIDKKFKSNDFIDYYNNLDKLTANEIFELIPSNNSILSKKLRMLDSITGKISC